MFAIILSANTLLGATRGTLNTNMCLHLQCKAALCKPHVQGMRRACAWNSIAQCMEYANCGGYNAATTELETPAPGP